MRFAIYLALAGALVLPGLLTIVTPRLAPKAAAVLLAAGALLSGGVWVGGLMILASTALGRLALAARIGHWSVGAFDTRSPVPTYVGILSLLALAVVAISLPRLGYRLVRGAKDLRRLHAICRHESGDITVIDSTEPEAVALPGWRGRVVVTTAMLETLDRDEQRVLIAHERSHVRGRHWLFRLATRVSAAALPTVRPLVARCDRTLERWADEDAASVVGDRRLTATTVTKAAMVVSGRQTLELAPSMAQGPVITRVEALLVPQPPSRWVLVAVTLAAGIAILGLWSDPTFPDTFLQATMVV